MIFPLTFWLKKGNISHLQKVQNKNFSVISKLHLSINFLAQNKTVFLISEKFKTINTIFSSPFWLKKDRPSILRKVPLLHKISSYGFLRELNDHVSWFLRYHGSFVNFKERSSFYQLSKLKKISFYTQKSIISTFPISRKFIIWNFPFLLIWTSISCKVVFVILFPS